MQIDAPQKVEPDGYGVKADVILRPTYSDRFNGKDTELDWIIKDIEDKN